MKKFFKALFILIGSIAGAGVAIRIAARRKPIPCPSWLAWMLDNPVMQGYAERILDGLDLQLGMKILDVGSGPGRITIPAAERVGPHGEVVAVDMQPAMLRKVEAHASAHNLNNIRLILGKTGGGLVAKDYFDRALVVTVLGEITNQAETLTEIFQALKPGGFLTICEMIPDPHFVPQVTVRRLAVETGFNAALQSSGKLGYTMRLYKAAAAEQTID